MGKALLNRIEKGILIALLFILPTQLAFHFWPTWAFVFGIRVDLLAPAIYLTDILVIFLFLLTILFKSGELKKNFLKHKILLGVILCFIFTNCIFSVSTPVSIYKWLKILEFSFIAYYFSEQRMINFSEIVKTVFYSSIAFSLIGISQFFKEGTIGGLLYFLGERKFTIGTPGIALVSLNGAEHLRAYSTFSHPNSLAGYLGALILLILLSGMLKRNISNLLGVMVILICFVLTFSVSAYIGIFVAFAFFIFSNSKTLLKRTILLFLLLSIVGSLLLPILSPWVLKAFPLIEQNISQRLDLAFISGKVISSHIFIGSGLGTYITNIPFYKGIFTYSWLLQPVHNIYLLIFTELGIGGLLAFCYIIYKSLTKALKDQRIYLLIPLVFILFTGLFDHYWLTLQQNLLLVSILFGLSFRISA